MNWKIALLVLLVSARVSAAGPLDDKTPAYFVDRYGPATESRMSTSESFRRPRVGGVPVKASFSVREFRKDDLRVTAIFFHPSLKLASVRLHLKHEWTADQVAAALQAYGGEWKPIGNRTATKEWIAPDGTEAASILNSLVFCSAEAIAMADKVVADDEAKRKAIPKF